MVNAHRIQLLCQVLYSSSIDACILHGPLVDLWNEQV